MFVIGAVLRGISLFLMWYISNPKLMKLSPPEQIVPTAQEGTPNEQRAVGN